MAWLAALVLLAIVLTGGCNRPEAETAQVKLSPDVESKKVIQPPVAKEKEPTVGVLEVNPADVEDHPLNIAASHQQAMGDWPLFRGDQEGSGVSRTTLPANDELDVLWEYKVKGSDGAFKSSPIVVRNQSTGRPTVYAADLDGKIYSIDLQTGQWNWKFQAGISIEASPAYKDGHIYIGDLDGNFFCLKEDGFLVWSKELEAPITCLLYTSPSPRDRG